MTAISCHLPESGHPPWPLFLFKPSFFFGFSPIKLIHRKCKTSNDKRSKLDKFDEIVDRRNTGSLKWDRYGERDVIPMWVADMDFRSPPEMREALGQHADHGVFGYANPTAKLNSLVAEKIFEKHRWEIVRAISPTNRLLAPLSSAREKRSK